MTAFTDSFKKLINGERFPENFFVPMLKWSSMSQDNIELSQRINLKFFDVNTKLLIDELVLYNMMTKFVKYPSELKKDKKLEFFSNDVCKYFNWSKTELRKNSGVINYSLLKKVIAREFGYTIEEKKLIGI